MASGPLFQLVQLIQVIYWLALSTWFGGVLFIAMAAPIIFRAVQKTEPILPTVLSVNLEGQHGTLLAGSIMADLITMLIRVEWVCAAAVAAAIIGQSFFLTGAHVWTTVLRAMLFFLAVIVLAYHWRVVAPRTAEARKKYIDHADEPEVANPAKEQFDHYHQESVTLLMALLFLLLGMVLFSASSLLTFIALPR